MRLSVILMCKFLVTPLQEYEVFQIEISKTYGKTEWHEDIKKVLKMAGEANKKVRTCGTSIVTCWVATFALSSTFDSLYLCIELYPILSSITV